MKLTGQLGAEVAQPDAVRIKLVVAGFLFSAKASEQTGARAKWGARDR